MITLPGSSRIWDVEQETDIFGTIVAGKNLNLRKSGYLALAKRAMVLYSEKEDADFSTVVAIGADNTHGYVVTTAAFFTVDFQSNTITVTKYIASDKPNVGFQSDLEFFNSQPHVTGTTDMRSYNGSAWATRISDLSASYPHPMARHGGRQTLLVADGNVCRQYSTGYSRDTSNELTISAEFVITRIIYRNNNAYLMTRNIAGGKAKCFVWNGVGVGNNGEYGVGADWIFSACEYGSGFAIVTSAGQLMEWNGGGFNELKNFPVYGTDFSWIAQAVTSSLIGNVASRGMAADGLHLYININGVLNQARGGPQGQYLHDMPSGLWMYSPGIGLYPTAAVNYKTRQNVEPSSVNSSIIKFSSAHQALTGDPIFCSSQNGLSGVTAGQVYYAIVISSTDMELALTPANAKAGIKVVITGTPGVQDTFSFDTYESMGSCQVTNAGPVFIPSKLTPNIFHGSKVLFGARAIDNALVDTGVFMGLGMGRNIGYFKTPKIASASITEAFQKLVAKYPMLNLDSQSFVVKYKTANRFGLPTRHSFSNGAIVFTSATTFTVDTTISDFRQAQEGDEVEFIVGAASGYLAHITAINDSNPASFVVTVDETLPVVNGDKTDIIVDNWHKLDVINASDKNNSQNFATRAIGKSATWVEFKVAVGGRESQMEQLILISEPNKNPN